MSASFELNDLEHFTVGTVGPPGQRVFYLQAGITGTVVSLKMEKEQVAFLANYLDAALHEISDDPDSVEPDVDIGLIEPVEEAWTVGEIRLGYEPEADRILIMATEVAAPGPDALGPDTLGGGSPDPGSVGGGALDAGADLATAQFRITQGQVAGFVARARQVVAAGRPPCRYCGAPLNEEGTWCPCSN